MQRALWRLCQSILTLQLLETQAHIKRVYHTMCIQALATRQANKNWMTSDRGSRPQCQIQETSSSPLIKYNYFCDVPFYYVFNSGTGQEPLYCTSESLAGKQLFDRGIWFCSRRPGRCIAGDVGQQVQPLYCSPSPFLFNLAG